MTEAIKNFYKVRYKDGKCDEEIINKLVSSNKLTQEEANEIMNQIT